MTEIAGFADLDPDSWIRTPQVAARMGYPSIERWYAEARRRAAAGFPRFRRRGLWRAGDLIEWDRAGGMSMTMEMPVLHAPPTPTTPANDAAQAATHSPTIRPELAERLKDMANRG